MTTDILTKVSGPNGVADVHSQNVAQATDPDELPEDFPDGTHLQGVPTLAEFTKNPPRGLAEPGSKEYVPD